MKEKQQTKVLSKILYMCLFREKQERPFTRVQYEHCKTLMDRGLCFLQRGLEQQIKPTFVIDEPAAFQALLFTLSPEPIRERLQKRLDKQRDFGKEERFERMVAISILCSAIKKKSKYSAFLLAKANSLSL